MGLFDYVLLCLMVNLILQLLDLLISAFFVYYSFVLKIMNLTEWIDEYESLETPQLDRLVKAS